ncbi:hypothetical protein BC937DRAFT_88063 [Endogone sp. FLAS-F59071]|nr:hypothetical protein BC937DRAFT_88063 [Endogone sp. FLAS-F59071]|eukprot:RUS19021.1 hypothetical protein BC937DRAFT_88063 [Endogone sp. FLAS-F59071]
MPLLEGLRRMKEGRVNRESETTPIFETSNKSNPLPSVCAPLPLCSSAPLFLYTPPGINGNGNELENIPSLRELGCHPYYLLQYAGLRLGHQQADSANRTHIIVSRKREYLIFSSSEVAGMVILFALLYASMLTIGLKRTSRLVDLLTPTIDFLLKWISILFCPALIMVANAPSVSPIEVGKIAAIFVAGFFIFIVVSSLIIRLMRLISPFKSKSEKEEAHSEMNDVASTVDSLQSNQGPETSSLAFEEMTPPTANQLTPETSTIDAGSSVVLSKPRLMVTSFMMPEVNLSTVSMRNSQLSILFQYSRSRLRQLTISQCLYLTLLFVSTLAYLFLPLSSPISPASRTLAELACIVLAYLAALTVPLRVRFFLHPMITCTAITLTFIAIIEVIKGRSLMEGLGDFSTGRRYLVILGGGGVAPDGTILWPGAGDVLFSLMDAAIVSLGIVMFKYRAELKKHPKRGSN